MLGLQVGDLAERFLPRRASSGIPFLRAQSSIVPTAVLHSLIRLRLGFVLIRVNSRQFVFSWKARIAGDYHLPPASAKISADCSALNWLSPLRSRRTSGLDAQSTACAD